MDDENMHNGQLMSISPGSSEGILIALGRIQYILLRHNSPVAYEDISMGFLFGKYKFTYKRKTLEGSHFEG